MSNMLRGEALVKQVDGKGLNIGRLLSELGSDSYVCLNVLGGRTGELVHTACKELGLSALTYWVEDETRINTAVVHEYEGRRYTQMINEDGPTLTAEETVGLKEFFRAHVMPNDMVVVSGSAAVGFGPQDLLDMAEIVAEVGAELSVDISGDWLESISTNSLHTLKVNEDEFRLAFGFDPTDRTRLLSFWKQHSIKVLIVTLGKQGSILMSNEGSFFAVSKAETLDLSVGSGDSFFAGYLFALQNGYQIDSQLRLATACGAANADAYGSALMTKADIERAHKFVEITEGTNAPIRGN